MLHLPAPSVSFTLSVDAQQLRNTPPSRQGALFASRTVSAPPISRPFPVRRGHLPDTVPWKGSRISIRELLETTHTNSFVVLRHGAIVHEWYGEGFAADTKQSSWSLAKSIVSLLAGRAIGTGKLREDDRLVDILPELATGTRYDAITVRHLLDMTSGVDVAERYDISDTAVDDAAAMYLTEDLFRFVREHQGLIFAPGSKARYRSIDAQLLGMVIARAEGRSLTALLQEGIWHPVGAQDDALWNLDHAGSGQEKAFCCLNATARDFAKIGQLVLDNGRAAGTQVVPLPWIARIQQPAPLPIEGHHYSAQWWHGRDGQELFAQGIFGQFIYVDRRSATVIVKLSDHDVSADVRDTIETFEAIAQTA
ncbi:serine hydrolase domain-containing protein [Nocardia goodfellowii]|uniref:serine hydrolase domain-containing protein n=1 Tax=Nocardia goodfellowii TaxID=882446 RepID=UPI001FD94B81|nr:serine hydrolase [Nocardia goodfellowii]